MDAALEKLIAELPDPDRARRFLDDFTAKHPGQSNKLQKNAALLSDVVTLASFSPLLAATMLQNPAYITWLDKKRKLSGINSKEELRESLGRFSLTNSTLAPHVLFARFRRRELLRIYLRDIRRLETIAEITEEISNLADTILESALDLARREMDNRYGQPQETDKKGRSTVARFCIVALGKLGSRELNYSSDLDLVFMYSREGNTSGTGSKGAVTNREYFVKLAEYLVKLVGEATGEGAAYRVDLRLRPNGRLGPIALSVDDTFRYYEKVARPWERQVMIRSRGCAGHTELFKQLFSRIEDIVFSAEETPATALANVRRSKEQIDREQGSTSGFNVKIGRGGIREIEFIAQALQLAYGGRDQWLRSPHTLISLDRLAERRHITDEELPALNAAYDFLRRTEHILQMENGVQTHTVPADGDRRAIVARRVEFTTDADFEKDLVRHTDSVHSAFSRVFGDSFVETDEPTHVSEAPDHTDRFRTHLISSIARSDSELVSGSAAASTLDRVAGVSPHFATILAANPDLATRLPQPEEISFDRDPQQVLMEGVTAATDLGGRLGSLRRAWASLLVQIVVADIFEKISIRKVKDQLTRLAEASIETALWIVSDELTSRFGTNVARAHLTVLALGKLGGGGVDYDSDLDLVLVYDDATQVPHGLTQEQYFGHAAELLITTLSSMTRDGSLYRVDLRLRPYGSKGLAAIPSQRFVEYMDSTAEVWELLAFVKLRAVAGSLALAAETETQIREIIYRRALDLPREELAAETRRVRLSLEKQRSRRNRTGEIDIKYGPGGMLDVYFAMRFLQLVHNVPDNGDDRSTAFMLRQLRDNGALSQETYDDLDAGYDFLSTLDHNLRLTVGRTTRVPIGKQQNLETIAKRMGLSSPADIIEQLTVHFLGIRAAFESIVQ